MMKKGVWFLAISTATVTSVAILFDIHYRVKQIMGPFVLRRLKYEVRCNVSLDAILCSALPVHSYHLLLFQKVMSEMVSKTVMRVECEMTKKQSQVCKY